MSECSHAIYLFQVPQVWLVPSYLVDNEQYARVIGRHTTGNAKADRMIQHELINCPAFLSDFAEIFSEGHRMGPVDKETGIKAFYHLTGHLIDWATHLTEIKLMNDKPIPITGLRQFSKLAEGVYKVAKEEGYDRELVVRRALWGTLAGGKRKRSSNASRIGEYNKAMIETIEEAYRRSRSMGMIEELWGGEFEKRRF